MGGVTPRYGDDRRDFLPPGLITGKLWAKLKGGIEVATVTTDVVPYTLKGI
jgi:hypothetical protein